MKRSMQISTLIIFAFLVVVPPAAFSEVKISLKNSRDIIADSCREVKDKLICEKMGGSFEIDKKEVSNLKEITIRRQVMPSGAEEGEGASGEKQVSGEKNAGVIGEKKSGDDSEPQAEGGFRGEISSDAKKQFDRIIQKKAELTVAREEIVKEREQLNKDVRNEGVIKNREQFEELKRRIAELDEKVKSFNEEAAELSRQEQNVIEEQTPKKQ